MKKILTLFLLILIIISSSRVLAENNNFTRISAYNISIVNPTLETNKPGAQFPGYRGANQLIIYTPEFGGYTGTNEYGKEAIVVNGKVFGFSGSNSYIPENGYVISGHGDAKTWMNQNLMEGAFIKLDLDSKKIESVITPESYLYKANYKLNEVQKTIIYYKKVIPGYQYNSAQSYYNYAFQKYQEAKYFISQNQSALAMDSLNLSLSSAQKAFYYAIPAMQNEIHGVWLRPVEQNRDEIAETLDKLKNTGINHIFLETYYQGYTIFPSHTMAIYSLVKQRPEFEGWDPLKDWIKEAHKRNMKIHVWFQAFYAGNDDVTKTPGHSLFVYPDWANVQRKNVQEDRPKFSVSEHNGYFLDPANHRVRQFLISLIGEISSKYDIDGLNIDYVRYPKSLSPDTNGYLDSTWGYSDYARKEFEKLYGRDPVDINESHNLWKKWIEYRQSKVNEFVSQVKKAVDDKDVVISAVVFPDIEEVSISKLQNWPAWTQNNYVDALTPLIMSSDELNAQKSVNEIVRITGNKINIYPGLFEPFTSGTPSNLLEQIVAVRKAGASGIIIFDNAHLNEYFIDALSTRVFKN